MTEMGHIGVVGGGAWGTALACLARRAGRRVTLWSRDPSVSAAIARDRSNPVYLPGFPLDAGIEAASDLAALGACDAILLVCPAQAVRELAARLAGTAPVVICAKGIEASSGLLMPEVLAEVLPGRPLAMLSGPSFAEEAMRGLPTAVSIATADHALGETLAGALAAGAFRPYWTRRRLRRGAGRRGEERARHRRRHRRGPRPRPQRGSRADHAWLRRDGPARPGDGRGAGDADRAERARRLVLTCHGPLSRNRSLGLALGKGTKLADYMAGRRQVVEGEATAPAVLARAARYKIEMPICAAVDAILHGGADLDEAIRALLARPLRREGK